MNTNDKLMEIAKDKELIEKLSKMSSVEEITEELNKQGVNITVDEMERALEIFNSKDEELDVDVLDNVSGGSITAGSIIGGAIIFWSAVSVVMGALDGFAAATYKTCKKKK